MPQYCFSFEFDASVLRGRGYTSHEISHMLGCELTFALAECGFDTRLGPLLFATSANTTNPLVSVASLTATLKKRLPDVVRSMSACRLFRMTDCSDITDALHEGLTESVQEVSRGGRVVPIR